MWEYLGYFQPSPALNGRGVIGAQGIKARKELLVTCGRVFTYRRVPARREGLFLPKQILCMHKVWQLNTQSC
jgi:hypothetical protein